MHKLRLDSNGILVDRFFAWRPSMSFPGDKWLHCQRSTIQFRLFRYIHSASIFSEQIWAPRGFAWHSWDSWHFNRHLRFVFISKCHNAFRSCCMNCSRNLCLASIVPANPNGLCRASQVRQGFTRLTSAPTSQSWCLHVQCTVIQFYSKTVTYWWEHPDFIVLVRADFKRVKPNRICCAIQHRAASTRRGTDSWTWLRDSEAGCSHKTLSREERSTIVSAFLWGYPAPNMNSMETHSSVSVLQSNPSVIWRTVAHSDDNESNRSNFLMLQCAGWIPQFMQ
jgi:hypothetical protein